MPADSYWKFRSWCVNKLFNVDLQPQNEGFPTIEDDDK